MSPREKTIEDEIRFVGILYELQEAYGKSGNYLSCSEYIEEYNK